MLSEAGHSAVMTTMPIAMWEILQLLKAQLKLTNKPSKISEFYGGIVPLSKTGNALCFAMVLPEGTVGVQAFITEFAIDGEWKSGNAATAAAPRRGRKPRIGKVAAEARSQDKFT